LISFLIGIDSLAFFCPVDVEDEVWVPPYIVSEHTNFTQVCDARFSICFAASNEGIYALIARHSST